MEMDEIIYFLEANVNYSRPFVVFLHLQCVSCEYTVEYKTAFGFL